MPGEQGTPHPARTATAHPSAPLDCARGLSPSPGPAPTPRAPPTATCVGQRAVALVPRHVVDTRALVQTGVGRAFVDVGLAVGACRGQQQGAAVSVTRCCGRVPPRRPPSPGRKGPALRHGPRADPASLHHRQQALPRAGGPRAREQVSALALQQERPAHSPLKPSRQAHT